MTANDGPAARRIVPHPDLTAAAVRASVPSIAPEFVASRQLVHAGLSALAGHEVVVKVESENPVGSFKGRGTWLAVRRLATAGGIGPGRPVVVASSGNFGLGVAYAARAAGVSAVVFCDAAANPVKADRIRTLGADLHLVGRDFDEARAASVAYAAANGLTLLVDGDDVAVATGAATMALEVTDAVDRGELPAIANAYVPVGNGALIVGVGAWLRERGGEGVRVVGVQSEAAPSMARSWREGRVVETPDAATYAEGIATRVPVPAALELMNGRVDEMLLVGEDARRAAQAVLTRELGLTAEGAAAASWAGLLADAGRRPGPSLVIVTGRQSPSGGWAARASSSNRRTRPPPDKEAPPRPGDDASGRLGADLVIGAPGSSAMLPGILPGLRRATGRGYRCSRSAAVGAVDDEATAYGLIKGSR